MYASAVGSVRGTRESSEELLATRAMRSLAHALCAFQPSAGRVLETSISGMTMVFSSLRGKEIEVVMKAPVQQPDCKVRTVVVAAPLAVQPVVIPEQEKTIKPEVSPKSDVELLRPDYTRSKNITVRVLSGEY